MNKRRLRWAAAAMAAVLGLLPLATVPASAETTGVTIDVTKAPYRATGDGVTNDRPAIQSALDFVGKTGGGTVVLPAGKTFLSGSLVLASGTTLRIDGTLLQSQRDADYASPQTHGHIYPSNISYKNGDLAVMHNTPMVHAANARNVDVVGHGTIQLTRVTGGTPKQNEDATIHVVAVGFHRVDRFAVRDIAMLGASSFTMALYTSRNGTVAGVRILATSEDANPAGGHNTDGIGIQNSQHLRITGNNIRSGDDGIVIAATYRDERGKNAWWNTDDPEPMTDVEIDHNRVVVDRRNAVLCCGGLAFIAWGADGAPTGGHAPDQRLVQISDIYAHDNHFESGYPVRCWCGGPNQSPITRVRLERNEYVWGFTPGDNLRAKITDFTSDDPQWYPYMAASSVMNGDFESTGDASWTTTGQAGATRASEPALGDPAARALLGEADGWVGYLRTLPNQRADITQGIRPTAPEDYPVPVDSVGYALSAKVATSGVPVQLVVRDRCDGHVVARQLVTATRWTDVRLPFSVTSHGCGGVRVGLESAGDRPGWALIDNVALKIDPVGTVVDDTDSSVALSGSWSRYFSQSDLGGSHLVGWAAGSNLTAAFAGTKATLWARRDKNLGKADIYVDGVLQGTADFYAPAVDNEPVPVFTTSALSPGTHTFELRTTGSKNPKSTNVYTVFDALTQS